MPRFHQTLDGLVPFTKEEETQFDELFANSLIEESELAKTQYQRDRAKEYPSINDYVDGIVKGDQAQIQAYIDACLAVKTKFPKPTE
jgi:uncharacterized protein (UPF0297 family)